jgi:uncharacterized protein (TIGR00369 family)
LKTLNPDHIKAVLDLINQGPYFRLLSMKVSEMGKGFAKVEMDIENKHLNPFGGVHGGVYSSLIDTAAYWAVYCDVEEDAGLISLDVKVDNLAPVKEGHLVVEGKRIKAGESICIADAAVIDEPLPKVKTVIWGGVHQFRFLHTRGLPGGEIMAHDTGNAYRKRG